MSTVDINTLRYTGLTTFGDNTTLSKTAWNRLLDIVDAIDTSSGGGLTTEETPIQSSTVTFPAYYAQYGTTTIPRTGNITVSPAADAEVYSVAYMWHNDTTSPTITGADEISSVDTDYTVGADNLLVFNYLPSGAIVQVVTQPSSPPIVESATVYNSADTEVVILLSEPVLFSTNGFTVNTGKTITSINGSGTDTITLTLSSSITNGETLTLDYSSTTGDVVNFGGTTLETFSGTSIDNQVEVNNILVSDDFNDNSINLTTWLPVFSADGETTIAETSNQMEISNAADATATDFAENRIVTIIGTEEGTVQATYTYTGNSSFARRNGIYFGIDENNYGSIYSSGGVLNAEIVISGTQVYNFNSVVSKDQTVRISYTDSSGTWSFDYLLTGVWTSFASDTQALSGDKYGGIAIISGGDFSSGGQMDDFYLTTDIGYTTSTPE